jgi:hypothetical protein
MMSDTVQANEGSLTVTFTNEQATATLLALAFMHTMAGPSGKVEESVLLISAIETIGEAIDRRDAASKKEDEFAKARGARKGEPA